MAYYGRDIEKYLDLVTDPEGYRGHPAPAPVLKEDAELIRLYLQEQIAQRGLADSTAKVTATNLCMFAQVHPSFSGLTDADIARGIAAARKSMKQNTLLPIYPGPETLFSWMTENGHNSSIDPRKLDAIKAPRGRPGHEERLCDADGRRSEGNH